MCLAWSLPRDLGSLGESHQQSPSFSVGACRQPGDGCHPTSHATGQRVQADVTSTFALGNLVLRRISTSQDIGDIDRRPDAFEVMVGWIKNRTGQVVPWPVPRGTKIRPALVVGSAIVPIIGLCDAANLASMQENRRCCLWEVVWIPFLRLSASSHRRILGSRLNESSMRPRFQ